MLQKTTPLILVSFLGLSVLAMILPGNAEAIFACFKAKTNQNDCGNSKCNRQATSLSILSDDLAGVGQSGWTAGPKCGWKFCSTLVCKCGEPLSSSSCTGDPCA